MNVRIRAIASRLPDRVVTNEDLQRERPDWPMDQVALRSGVLSRRIVAEGETALDLAEHAARALLDGQPGLRERVGALLFCTQTGDHVMPPNACILHHRLGLPENVLAFDYNLACSGFVYGLAVAQGLIASRLSTDVLLVTADTYSKLIHPGDRSARTLFGDGAAATWLDGAETGGLVDVICATSGRDHARFVVPAGGCRLPRSAETAVEVTDGSGNVRTADHIHMDGLGVLAFVTSKVPPQVRALLARQQLTVADVDLWVFHQASRITLETLTKLLDIPPDRLVDNLAHVGNTVSASIPLALKAAQDAGRVRPGMRILLCGFGVGLSWATALVEA